MRVCVGAVALVFGDGLHLHPEEEKEKEKEGARQLYSRASEAALFRAVQLCPDLAAHLASAAVGGC